jgi:hypothetical protein
MRKLGIVVALMMLSVGAQGLADQTRHSGTMGAAVGAVHENFHAARDTSSSQDGRASNSSNHSSTDHAASRNRTSEHNR